MALSASSVAVWRFVHGYIRKYGYPPTGREMAVGCYLSRSAVDRALWRLVEAGVIEREERTARGIRLLVEPPEAR